MNSEQIGRAAAEHVKPGLIAYIAESQEPTFPMKDPLGLSGPDDAEVRLHVVTVGVFSTYANAEAALDMRTSRFRWVEVAGLFVQNSFRVDGLGSWERTVRWADPTRDQEWGTQECWQQILAIKIDEHDS